MADFSGSLLAAGAATGLTSSVGSVEVLAGPSAREEPAKSPRESPRVNESDFIRLGAMLDAPTPVKRKPDRTPSHVQAPVAVGSRALARRAPMRRHTHRHRSPAAAPRSQAPCRPGRNRRRAQPVQIV